MYYGSISNDVTLRKFLKELCLFVNLEYNKCPVFRIFSASCFDILSWHFAHDFVWMYYKSHSNVVPLHQFLKELCPVLNIEYRKYTVYRSFLLHALTCWAEILPLFWCTTDQVRVSSLCINVWRSYVSFGTYNIGNTKFAAVFSCMLRYIELKFCTWLCFNILRINFEFCHFASMFEGAKSRKYQGVCEVKSRVKTWQVRGIWSQQLEH